MSDEPSIKIGPSPQERFRFTAWLTSVEREGLRDKAIELGLSQNVIVRMAIRETLGLPGRAVGTLVTRNGSDT